MLDNRFETPKTNGVDRDRHHHTLNPDPTPRQPQPTRDLPAFTMRPQAAQLLDTGSPRGSPGSTIEGSLDLKRT
jgi:hypothetical protein